jgi:hypothetical protein
VYSEGGDPLIISHCDIQGGGSGEGNFDADPRFVQDGVSGEVKSVNYDAARAQTKIATAGAIADAAKLAGRVVQVGGQWGVIAGANGNELVAWGDLRPAQGQPAPAKFQVTRTYRLAADSPCVGKGARIPEKLTAKSPMHDRVRGTGPMDVGATVPAASTSSGLSSSGSTDRTAATPGR